MLTHLLLYTFMRQTSNLWMIVTNLLADSVFAQYATTDAELEVVEIQKLFSIVTANTNTGFTHHMFKLILLSELALSVSPSSIRVTMKPLGNPSWIAFISHREPPFPPPSQHRLLLLGSPEYNSIEPQGEKSAFQDPTT